MTAPPYSVEDFASQYLRPEFRTKLRPDGCNHSREDREAMEAISPSIGAWAVLVAVKCGSRDGKSSGEQFSLPRRPILPVMPASSTTTLPRCPLTRLQFTSHTVALIPLSLLFKVSSTRRRVSHHDWSN